MDTSSNTSGSTTGSSACLRPTVTFQQLTFSDNSTMAISPTDVVVFVGPNNTGKSLLLQELEGSLENCTREGKVLISSCLYRNGTADDVRATLNRTSRLSSQGYYTIYGSGIADIAIPSLWKHNLEHLSRLFCKRLNTESRLADSNPARSISYYNESPSNPIHILYKHVDIEENISRYFYNAFGLDVTMHRLGGNEWALLEHRRIGWNR